MSLPELPPPLHPGRYRIAVVCLGNICRSPMAHVVLEERVAAAGLDDVVEVLSAGTGSWHVGEGMDRRAARLLTARGYDATRHVAQQARAAWLVDGDDALDLVLAMDAQNRHDLRGLAPDGDPTRLMLFRDLDPEAPGADVPDPWSGGPQQFEQVLAMVERTCDEITVRLAALLTPPAP